MPTGKEVLLRVANKTNPDSLFLDVGCLKRGDVVCVVDIGHQWSQLELTNPDWRIIRTASLTDEAASTFTVPEPEIDPQNPNPVKQRRAFMFDFDSQILSQAFLDFLNDDTRAVSIYETSATLEQVMTLKIPRPTRMDEVVL